MEERRVQKSGGKKRTKSVKINDILKEKLDFGGAEKKEIAEIRLTSVRSSICSWNGVAVDILRPIRYILELQVGSKGGRF